MTKDRAGFSVIMPTYKQAAFIRNAIKSLIAQTYSHWELIIINDGSTDATEEFIADFLSEPRIIYLKNKLNEGLGYSINRGLDIAKYNYIAYLPSDDFYYANHLETLFNTFKSDNSIILAYTTTNSDSIDSYSKYQTTTHINGLPESRSPQLVQVAHKKTQDRWVTRSAWDSINLFELFFHKLVSKGFMKHIDLITSKWVSHPEQRHKIMCENFGGSLNRYRQYYQVKTPIRLRVSEDKLIDEEKQFRYLEEELTTPTERPLKILLVGELSSNGERICALSQQGHQLYGLWMQDPYYSFFTVGPLPYGNIIDISYENWREEIRRINPDIIYALQSFGAVAIAHEVLEEDLGIPFIWHFKEGPSASMQNGSWRKLIELLGKSDANIYINESAKQLYEQFLPISHRPYLILDGDLPKMTYFSQDYSPKLSDKDGHTHTVIPGRIIGLTIDDIAQLATHNIHIHLYIESYHSAKELFNQQALTVAPNHFHIHSHCPAQNWVREFSQYDAGWLHCFNSNNEGDIRRVGWDDINLPARMNTLAAAGIPMIQRNNHHHIVAMQKIVLDKNIGILFNDIDDLAVQLQNKQKLQLLSDNVKKHRYEFSFDYHLAQIIDFFEHVISLRSCKKRK